MTAFTYGMEFEVQGVSPAKAANALNLGGIDCDRVQEDIHDDDRDCWKAVFDGSVANGAEVVSPILDDSRLNEASKVTRILTQAGASVDRATGFHVHIGFNAFSNAASGESNTDALARFILNYYATHHAIGALVAPSRLRNHFCKVLNRSEAESEASWIRGGNLSSNFQSRYYSLNLESLRRHGTIEIRLHQGTLNGVKAIAWAKFIASMIDATKRGADLAAIEGINAWQPLEYNRGASDLTACGLLIDHLTASGDLKPATGDWLKGRAARLNG